MSSTSDRDAACTAAAAVWLAREDMAALCARQHTPEGARAILRQAMRRLEAAFELLPPAARSVARHADVILRHKIPCEPECAQNLVAMLDDELASFIASGVPVPVYPDET